MENNENNIEAPEEKVETPEEEVSEEKDTPEVTGTPEEAPESSSTSWAGNHTVGANQ